MDEYKDKQHNQCSNKMHKYKIKKIIKWIKFVNAQIKDRREKCLCSETLLQSESCDVDLFMMAVSTRFEYQTKILNPIGLFQQNILEKELKHLKHVFHKINGYSWWVIDQVSTSFLENFAICCT